MRVVRQLDEEVWKAAVENCPTGNIFHTPEMFRVFARTKGYTPSLWAAVDRAGEVLALMLPVEVTLKNGPFRPFTTRAVAYGSVMHVPGPQGEEALSRLLHTYTRQAPGVLLFTELRNLSDLAPVQSVLRQCDFVYEEHLNYLIDLTRPKEDLLGSVSSRTRSYIRRGLAPGALRFRAAANREQVAICYDLLRRTYQNAHVPLVDRSLFENLFDVLSPRDMVRFTLACRDETPIATSVDLLYKGVIYYWYGGMDRAYGSEHPNEPLRWHIIEWGIDQGYTLFDFGGAGKPDEEYGVREFKAKFGGKLVNYGRNICTHAPLRMGLSKFGYQVLRRLL